MTEEPEVWGTWAVGGIEEARVGPISTKYLDIRRIHRIC